MTHVGQMLIRVHDGKVTSMYDIQMLVFLLAKSGESNQDNASRRTGKNIMQLIVNIIK